MSLAGGREWTLLGGEDQPKKPLECIVRSYDRAIEAVASQQRGGPAADTPAVHVPRGEGRRLTGSYFFARPVESGPPCRVGVRGAPAPDGLAARAAV